jgi:hypothetical protein
MSLSGVTDFCGELINPAYSSLNYSFSRAISGAVITLTLCRTLILHSINLMTFYNFNTLFTQLPVVAPFPLPTDSVS